MNNSDLLVDQTFVAFDTETSGAYPVGFDVVEFGAVKWKNGQEIGQLQFLLKPREKMSDFIIGIHGISNEMVENAPLIGTVLPQISDFFQGTVLLAHHAPFDIGFLAYEFEKHGFPFPQSTILCTSLMSRKLIHGCENHKLQTLIPFLGIPQGAAHRALDDARACLQVGLKCFEKMAPNASLSEAQKIQAKEIVWENYTIQSSVDSRLGDLARAVLEKKSVELNYDNAKAARKIQPIGIVRSPDGDFVQANCLRDQALKRFYISKMQNIKVLPF